MSKSNLFLVLISFYCFSALAQHPKKPSSSELFQAIEKLNFLGSVLYIAAHPDDENTKLIAHMANAVKARTGYLSLTRGDGGQNLIGTELGSLLGVIRTQELLEARKIDGGEQLFTRANDFGYSKHPDETLAIWDKNEILSDVVWAIRKFQPDIIINRFDHRSPGKTHGHHTSSAILSMEAFDMAADQSKFSSQLKWVDTWQAKREFFNTSWWFYGSQDNFNASDKTGLFSIEVGDYYALLGLSNPEIAALSRSAHKSQGFGNTGARGSDLEYLELVKGDSPKDENNIFEGIDTSWNRVKGGKVIGELLKTVQDQYDFNDPSASIPKLLEAYRHIQNLEDGHWKRIKLEDLKNVIAACAGLYLEAVAASPSATPDSKVDLTLEAINRSALHITLKSVVLSDGTSITKNSNLLFNQAHHFKSTLTIPSTASYTAPYWLNHRAGLGMYQVARQELIGLPETPKSHTATFHLVVQGTALTYEKPIVYKINDPVAGEVYRPFEIVPEVTSSLSDPVIIFADDRQKEVQVRVKANRNHLEAFVQLAHPNGWKVYPEKQAVSIANKGAEQVLTFTVIPPMHQSEGLLSPVVQVGDATYTKKLVEIDYNHILTQTVLLPNESKIVRLNLKKKGEHIGYIEGAGDKVPESLRQIGYKVTVLKPDAITPETLQNFDAVVIGIRAYNTVESLKFKQKSLFDFVKQGGNLIVQYNTNSDLILDQLAPYPLTLSRDRVTDENSEVKIIDINNELLNYPNKIDQNDFKGWVQERGLYFPNKWSTAFTPVLSMHDKNEAPKEGSLLIAKYGKGYYIYTGLSFFRELPEGVAGAFRLFANMLSVGKEALNAGSHFKN